MAHLQLIPCLWRFMDAARGIECICILGGLWKKHCFVFYSLRNWRESFLYDNWILTIIMAGQLLLRINTFEEEALVSNTMSIPDKKVK